MPATAAVTPPLPADEARATIIAQHQTIRMLLEAAGAVADLAAGGNRRTGELLPLYLENVRNALEHHLATEEQVLLPILAADPPLGPERALRLAAEHDRQREELAAAQRELSRPGGRETAAKRLRLLINDLLVDMAEEERCLLGRDVLRDDGVSIDQDCG
jgi:iron-sulfur cluster repair protein YtfE (RIC family)